MGAVRGQGSSPPAVPPLPSPHLLGRRIRTHLDHPPEAISVDCDHTRGLLHTPQTQASALHGPCTRVPYGSGVCKTLKEGHRKLGLKAE